MGKYKSGAVRPCSFVLLSWITAVEKAFSVTAELITVSEQMKLYGGAWHQLMFYSLVNDREDYIDHKVSAKWPSVRFKVSTNHVGAAEDELQIRRHCTHRHTKK